MIPVVEQTTDDLKVPSLILVKLQIFHRNVTKTFTSLFMAGRYQTLQTMAQLLIILSR